MVGEGVTPPPDQTPLDWALDSIELEMAQAYKDGDSKKWYALRAAKIGLITRRPTILGGLACAIGIHNHKPIHCARCGHPYNTQLFPLQQDNVGGKNKHENE